MRHRHALLVVPVVVACLLPAAAPAKTTSCGKTRLYYIIGKTYTATVTKSGPVSCATAKAAVKYFGRRQKDPRGWDCSAGNSQTTGKVTITCKRGRSTAKARFGPLF